jgi:hypothetical protein
MTDYIDYETDKIISELKTCPTGGDVFKLIYSTFPNWIIDSYESYSTDYEILQNNWLQTCIKLNYIPQKIIMVDKLNQPSQKQDELQNQYILISTFSEVLTKMGFIVRSKYDIISCVVCNKVLLSELLYNSIESSHFIKPSRWSNKCINCSN